jgi:hypothetical protein
MAAGRDGLQPDTRDRRHGGEVEVHDVAGRARHGADVEARRRGWLLRKERDRVGSLGLVFSQRLRPCLGLSVAHRRVEDPVDPSPEREEPATGHVGVGREDQQQRRLTPVVPQAGVQLPDALELEGLQRRIHQDDDVAEPLQRPLERLPGRLGARIGLRGLDQLLLERARDGLEEHLRAEAVTDAGHPHVRRRRPPVLVAGAIDAVQAKEEFPQVAVPDALGRVLPVPEREVAQRHGQGHPAPADVDPEDVHVAAAGEDLPGAPVGAWLAGQPVVELVPDVLEGPGEADRVVVVRRGVVMPAMDDEDDDGVGAPRRRRDGLERAGRHLRIPERAVVVDLDDEVVRVREGSARLEEVLVGEAARPQHERQSRRGDESSRRSHRDSWRAVRRRPTEG